MEKSQLSMLILNLICEAREVYSIWMRWLLVDTAGSNVDENDV